MLQETSPRAPPQRAKRHKDEDGEGDEKFEEGKSGAEREEPAEADRAEGAAGEEAATTTGEGEKPAATSDVSRLMSHI